MLKHMKNETFLCVICRKC